MKIINVHINKKSKLVQSITLIFILSILSYFLVFSKTNYEIMLSIIEIFITIIIPSLFPFILFSNLLIYSNYFTLLTNTIITKLLQRFFKTSSYGTSAIIFGFLFGYPNGARYVNELYETGKISFNEAEYLLMFINNSSPAFVISSIGIGMFKNIRIGLFLLISHILASIILGKSLSNKYISTTYIANNESKSKCSLSFEVITKSITKSIYTMCMIFGFMIIFILLHNYVLTIINYIIPNSEYLSTFLLCISEISSGLNKFILLPINLKLLLPLISFFLGFSSLSINFQIFSCVHNNKFKLKNILKGKFLHGILSGILSYILINVANVYSYINVSTNANLNLNIYTYSNTLNNPLLTSLLVFITILALFSFITKKRND